MAPCSTHCYLPNELFSWTVGNDDPDNVFTSESEALQAMFACMVKRDEDYDENDWNYWRSKLENHDRQILSMILETGATEKDSVLANATLRLFIDHYNKCAESGNRFRIIKMELCR